MTWLINSLPFTLLSNISCKTTNNSKIFTTFVRNYAAPKAWKQDAVRYGQVKYYPRNLDHKDPPFTPSKLLMVQLVKPYAGNPYWDKNILKGFGIAERGREPVIVKNTPEICALLWKVKHLVKITPIKLPEKLPDLEDLGSTYLHDNGTFQVLPKLDPLRVEASEEFENSPKKLNGPLIVETLRLQWMNGVTP